MIDLHAELLALIQAVREETPHAPKCWSLLKYERPTGGARSQWPCDCDRQARFEAELARRWERSIDAAINDVADHFEEHSILDSEEAALAAAREAPHAD